MAKPISVRSGDIEFLKLNTQQWAWRDIYQWLLSLSWPAFAAFIGAAYIAINVLFAVVYLLGPGSIAGLPAHSFVDSFFFSVQTLATVGYGHWYPQTLYGHITSTLEIVSGMFGLAVITGLIFVRFSRPTARILFSKSIVIGPLDGRPTLMIRIGNLRQDMREARFYMIFARDIQIAEGESFRYFYELKMHFSRLPAFPAALTLRHDIDEQSPLWGETPESLEASRGVFIVSVTGIDPVIAAAVQTHQNYTWRDLRFNHRFVDIYTEHGNGRLSVDFGRLHDVEPVKSPEKIGEIRPT